MQEMQEMGIQSLGWEDPLEKEMATYSSILAWKIPWTEEPGRGVTKSQTDWGPSRWTSKEGLCLMFTLILFRCDFFLILIAFPGTGFLKNK